MSFIKNVWNRLCNRNNIPKDLVDYRIVTSLEDECIICLQDFKQNDCVTLVKCGHIYHTECLYIWFLKKRTCPICDIEVQL
jgi:hypothetical protein